MGKKRTLKELLKRTSFAPFTSLEEYQEEIRNLSDRDESFENLVFELGVDVLARYCVKKGAE